MDVGTRGMVFSVRQGKPPVACSSLGDNVVKMAILLRRNSQGFAPWREFVQRCSRLVSKNYLAMVSAGRQDVASASALEGYLRRFSLRRSRRKEILAAYRLHHARRRQRRVVAAIIKFAATKESSFLENQRMLQLARSADSPVLRDLIELALAVRVGNRGWAKKVVHRFVHQGKSAGLFGLEEFFFTDQKQVRDFEEAVYQLLGNMPSKDKLRRVALSYVDDIFARSSVSPWSLSEIREALSGRALGGKFFGFWISKLIGRVSHVEIVQAFSRVVGKEFLSRMELSELWVFNYHFPADVHLRKLIVDKIELAWNSGNPRLRYLVLQLLSKSAIKKSMGQRDAFFGRGHFQLERNFYQDLLARPLALNFALYNLARLGDKNETRLWWLVYNSFD